MSKSIEVEMDHDIACVMLNRPQAYNAFDLPMVQQLADSLIPLAADKRVRGVVISGRGKAFCAGGDLKWGLTYSRGGAPAGFHELAARFHLAVQEIRRMPKPVIAAVNGAAAGGGFSLALACDFRVMSESAVLRQAYTSNGLCIDGGGTFTLPRMVGLARALEIAAFDEPIDSGKALAWGLVTKLAADGKALEEALEMAHKLAGISMNSFGWSKQLLLDSFNSSFETHLERERRGLAHCASHTEGQEGLAAFAQKRKPVFTSNDY